MERVFKYKKGQLWDGDEEIFYFIEDYLTEKPDGNYPQIKEDLKVTVIVEKKNK